MINTTNDMTIEQEEFTVENLDGYSDAAGKPIKRSVLKRAPALRKKPLRKQAAVKAGQGRGISKPKKVIKKPIAKPTIKRPASVKPVAKPAIRRPAPVKRAPVSIPAPAPAPKIQTPVPAVAPVKRAIPVKKSLNPIMGNQKITIPAKGDYVEQQPVSPAKRSMVTKPAAAVKSTGGPGLKIITKNDIIIEGDEKYDSAEGKPKNNLTKTLISVAVIGVVAAFMFKFIK